MALQSSGQISLKDVIDEAIFGGFPIAGIGDWIGPNFDSGVDFADMEENIDNLSHWPGWDVSPNLTPAEPWDIEEFYSAGTLAVIETEGAVHAINTVPGTDSTYIFKSCIYLNSTKAVIGWHEGSGNATQMYLRTFNAPTTGAPTDWGAEFSVTTDSLTLVGYISLVTLEGGAEDGFFGMFTEQILDDDDKRRIACFSVDGSGDITEEDSITETSEESDFFAIAYLKKEHFDDGGDDAWNVCTITLDSATGRPEYRVFKILLASGTWTITEEDSEVLADDSPYSFSNQFTFLINEDSGPELSAIGMVSISNGTETPKQLMVCTQVTGIESVSLTEEDSDDVDSGLHYFAPIHAAYSMRSGAILREWVVIVGHEIDSADGTTRLGGQITLSKDGGAPLSGLLEYESTLNFSDEEIDDAEIHYLEDDDLNAYFIILYRLASNHEQLKIQLIKTSATPNPEACFLLGEPINIASDLADTNHHRWTAYVYPGQAIGSQRVYVCWGRDEGQAAQFRCYKISANLASL